MSIDAIGKKANELIVPDIGYLNMVAVAADEAFLLLLLLLLYGRVIILLVLVPAIIEFPKLLSDDTIFDGDKLTVADG